MNFIRNILGKPKYQKKIGPPWTLHKLLNHLSLELTSLKPNLESSTLSFAGRDNFSITFIRNQFPPDDTMVEINGSIILSDDTYIADLFHLAKPYFGSRVRPLGIHKDEAWEGSQIQKQLREFYLPFLDELTKSPKNELTPNHVDEIASRLQNQLAKN